MVPAAIVALLLFWHPAAHATVYSWKSEGGVLMLSNDPGDVPEDQQASAQKFTSKPAPRAVPGEDATVQPPSAGAPEVDAYQRGFDAGLDSAERQVALAAELARTLVATVPQAPPAPIIIEQSAPPVAPGAAAYYAPPYYDNFAGSYAPYAPYPFPYGFAVNVVSHRRFSPGAHGHRFAPFFPHGRFSRGWTGRMR